MYFNFWSGENYILKWFFLTLLLFIIIFIILKILIQAHKKYKITHNIKLRKNKIISIINSDTDEKTKFEQITRLLGLNSSYKIENFTKIKNEEILDLIKQKKYSTINNIIYNNIINNE